MDRGQVLGVRRHGRLWRLRLAMLRDTLPGEGDEEGQVGEDSGETEPCEFLQISGAQFNSILKILTKILTKSIFDKETWTNSFFRNYFVITY